MTSTDVDSYLLSLLCSTLRGKVPVVLPHLKMLNDEERSSISKISGNNVAWNTLIRSCSSNHGIGLVELAVVLENLGCPNLADSVFRGT